MKKNNYFKIFLKSIVKITDPGGLLQNGFQKLKKEHEVTIYY